MVHVHFMNEMIMIGVQSLTIGMRIWIYFPSIYLKLISWCYFDYGDNDLGQFLSNAIDMKHGNNEFE